ncbi:Rab3 GTPase-activating protein catalytic subunit [Dissophora ornata]|nr:Rab3 GTPase-activating protein catalytic subunit [Dissophora ornata]
MEDFENFEFIDYTTSGPWERFITQIEDSLRSWGLVDGKLGVLDPATVAATQPTDSSAQIHTSEDHFGTKQGDQGDGHIHLDDKMNSAPLYQLREMLSLDDATYALSYHYHPAKARAAAGIERIDHDFLPTTLEGIQHHCLHRWTSLTHILVISPVTISDIFASTMSSSSASSAIIDLSSAKLLLSSFAIAFQNTGCNIPVFVPTGQPWNLTFTGLLIQPQAPAPTPRSTLEEQEIDSDLEFEDDNQGVEIRFNTAVVPYPPVQYSHLSGIMDLFVERMEIEDNNHVASPGNYNQRTKERIYTTALFCYDLVNWYDEDWRRWKQPVDKEAAESKGMCDDADTPFQVDEEPTMNTPASSMNIEDIKTEGGTLSTLPVPVLPFGPSQDPLRSVRLLARFATAPSTIYLDSKNIADMDASYANIWILHATFKTDDFGILSGIMEDAIASWNSEVAGTGRRGRKSDEEQTYSSILSQGARLMQGTINMVDAVDVENIVDALFEPSQLPAPTSPSIDPVQRSDSNHIRLIPASELGLRFRHATTVPCNSFLWRMIQYLLDVISPNSEISYATSVMGFMKLLWSELLKQLYARWEDSQLIPAVDIYGEGYSGSPKSKEDPNADQEKKAVPIDLRYNLIHQKLSMLNCCIARQISRNKEDPGEYHSVVKRRKDRPMERELETASSENMPTIGSEPAYAGRTAQFQNLLHGLSDISRPRSADVVPMAKRLLETVKNRGVTPPQQQGANSTDTTSFPSTSSSLSGFSTSHSQSKTEPSSPTAAMPIPKVEMSRRTRGSSSRHHARESTMGSDDDDDVFYDPMEMGESVLDPPGIRRRAAHSLSESFVALKYSSSADSQSGVLVNVLDQSTVNASGPDPREVADETKSEGGVMPLKDLKLLKTGAPLLIPKVQEPGYMTEDMVLQQNEVFETLGSSSDGAKMRAKIQSPQLISDMEAFKAANPGCVLGDFIRWYSPKDWVEDKGEFSARMADAGNYWQELWAHSKRIPVSRQISLFNHNQEAAKALHYLDGISADQLFLQLLPTMCLIAYDTLVSHPIASHIQQVARRLQELGHVLTRFPWSELAVCNEYDNHGGTGHEENNQLRLDVMIDTFREAELLMGRAIALVRKFPEQYGLVDRILESGLDGYETVVEDGPERECVYELFSIGGSLQSSFPQPTSREFVVETYDPAANSAATSGGSPPTLGWDSRPLQRRMYACFKESEVRIVEAIAKDGLYM